VDTRSNDEPAATTQPAPSQKAVPTVRDAPVEAVAETPTPAERTASASARTWSVQVGAFGSADSARKLAAELTQSGYAAYVSATTRGGKTLHRVRVGTEPAKADAVSLASRLKARGLPATVVVND
jgi:cell division septation protein DedD